MGYRPGPTSARANPASDTTKPQQWQPMGSGGKPGANSDSREPGRSPVGASLPPGPAGGSSVVPLPHHNPQGDAPKG
jgi:hypothetical protein